MRAQIRLELRRVFTRGSTYAIAAGGIAAMLLSVVGGASQLLEQVQSGQHTPEYVTHLLIGMAFTLTLFSAIIGAISVTRDVRSQTAATLYTFSRSRLSVHVAKAAASAVAGVALAVPGLLAGWLATSLLMGHKDIPVELGANPAVWLGGYVLVIALTAVLGVGAGFVLRSQLLAVMALVLWMTMLEASIVHFFPTVGRWLPGGAEAAIVADTELVERLSGGAGVALLLAWLALVALAGQRRLETHEP